MLFLLKYLISILATCCVRGVASVWVIQRGIRTLIGPFPTGSIRVYYGHDRIPGRREMAFGGVVKFQLLQGVFPNSPGDFNVLYMVSSRTPYGAEATAWFAKRKGLRLVWNQDGVAYPAWYGPGWERRNEPMARMLHAADHVFYQSEFCKLSADRYLGMRKGGWEILYNAVDTSFFTPRESAPDPGELVLLLAGSQNRYYRFAAAVRTLALVRRERPGTRLLVAGRLSWAFGREAAQAASDLLDQSGQSEWVTFLGAYSQSEAPSIFQQAHLLLHTQYNDACPGIVLEAMACGLPVVYSDSGGVPELVGEEAGIGVPGGLNWDREIPPDPEALAKAVLEVAERRWEYSEAARQRAVKRFDSAPWIQRHVEVFEGLMRSRSPGGLGAAGPASAHQDSA